MGHSPHSLSPKIPVVVATGDGVWQHNAQEKIYPSKVVVFLIYISFVLKPKYNK